MSAVSLNDLWFTYPDGTEALRGASFEASPGERVAVLGPNGAGKTTLMLHLNGILEAQRGVITVGGIAVERKTIRDIRRRVGMVFQDPDDQLFMPTVSQDVAFGPQNFGIDEIEAVVDAALKAVGMEHTSERAPHHLSGGERRRIAIATVLATDPDVLVLDEPTSNVDPAGRRELIEVLESLDMTMLVVTHDLPFALELCPRSLIVNGGRVVADGPTRELLGNGALMAANRLELPFGMVLSD